MPYRSQERHRAPAVLIGLDSLQGLQAARILAQHNIPVIAVAANPHHYCCRTNVCEEVIITDTESEQLIGTLEALGPKLDHKAVLFPCEDANVLLVSRYRKRLEAWYHIVLPAPEVIEVMLNKVNFYKYAQHRGLPIPRTFFIAHRSDLEKIIDQLTFPCILKPANSATPAWERHTTRSAFKVTQPHELLTLYDLHKAWAEAFVVQEWIEGPDTNHYTCNCYFDAASEPVVTFITRKLRQWPPNTGIGCLGEEDRNDTVLHETIQLFRSVQFRGLAYLEMKRDERSGKYFIVEPNVGRPTGRSATAEAGGVELLYTMYCDALGLPLPMNRAQKYTGVKWIYLRRDLQSALYRWWHGELTLKAWRRSWRGRKTYAVFSWRDPLPFLVDLVKTARLWFATQESGKSNYQHLSETN